jgi:TonB family protein
MKALKEYWPYLAAAFLGFLVIVLAEPFSIWFASQGKRQDGLPVGRLTQGVGTVHHAHGANDTVITLPVTQPLELHDGDRVQTAAASKAEINLNSQDEIELAPETVVEFQLWNPRDPGSPIYINLLSGSINSRHPGVKGKAYLVKDGRLYLPDQTPQAKPLALTVLRNAPLDMQLNETGHGGGAGGEFEADTTPDEAAAAAPPSGADPETLSNEYIDEAILTHQGQLQKCWLSRLKDAPASKGQIVVQFEISKRGKVKEMRVADSTLTDEVLQRCVMSVIERIPFRPYKGSEISLSYPINFE